MSDVPRQTLRELIVKYGPDLCSDARRCEGLLRDLCGAHRREINILIGALEERIPLDLLAAHSAMPRQLLLTRLAKRLEDQLALTEDAARWAVDSWALALGVVTETEVEERERKRVDANPPPPTTATARPSTVDDSALKESTEAGNAQPPLTSPIHPRQQTAPAQPPAIPRFPNAPPAATPQKAAPSPAGGQVLPRPSAGPSSATPLRPPLAAAQPRDPSSGPVPKGRRGRWRGCLIGCFLLVLLSLLLIFAAPFVVSVLREEQRQVSDESPRIPAQ